MSNPSHLFTQHSRHWRNNQLVYPVISRRSRGLSIGVNLNPDQACNFDCVYCSVDRTKPPAVRSVDLQIVRTELHHLLQLVDSGELFNQPPFDATPAPLRRLNDIAFSGDGEPTACSQFGPACELVADLLADRPAVKIVVITNATLLHQPRVVDALAFLDQHRGEIWAKLDAGTEAYYRQIEQTRVSLNRVLANILQAGKARPIVIQSLFLRLAGAGPSDAEITAYVDRLRQLQSSGCRIKLVQVYTVARDTARKDVQPLNNPRLDETTRAVQALGLSAETFYGPS